MLTAFGQSVVSAQLYSQAFTLAPKAGSVTHSKPQSQSESKPQPVTNSVVGTQPLLDPVVEPLVVPPVEALVEPPEVTAPFVLAPPVDAA